MMKKLTEEQIGSINEALKKIGVMYVDILHEMTDHIAAALEEEESERSFERNLRHYIYTNKSELKRLNRKYIFTSWMRSWKGLLLNVLTIRFMAFVVLVYLALTGVSILMERGSFVALMFFVFCFANGAVSFPEVHRMVKKKDQYSAGEGLGILNVFVFFPALFSIRYMDTVSSDTVVVLYFTALISICAVMAITKRRLKSNYKLRYNG
jgi:ABC-type multidrug transport system fused ATPase/permease subunit